MLGHQVNKCNGLQESHDKRTVAKFKEWLKKIPEFRNQLRERAEKTAEKEQENAEKVAISAAKTQAEIMSKVVRDTQEVRNTTQLVKPRYPPGWTGQKFDKWKVEIEKWSVNSKASEEDKFIDLIESLKRNEAIKEFVTKSLMEKVGETRTVEKILRVMAEKFSKTICEQVRDTMRKICTFKMSGSVDSLIDNFEEMLLEMAKLEMSTTRMEYALSAQFVDRLAESGKIDSTEKLRLKDILEESDGTPRRGETTELMKRELKRLKVAEHREKPFANLPHANKEKVTNYVKNDYRSRMDDWKSKGYTRSESRPGYYRTASRGRYMRDSSKYGGRSPSRPNGNSRPYRDGSRIRSQSRGKNPESSNGSREKSAERPKSNLEKKVESNEKKLSTVEQSVKKIEEMLKKVTISTQFVEEEIFIDIKYVQRETDNSMIIDSGAPVSLISYAWLKNYMAEAKVGEESIKQENNSRRFRLGKTLYISKKTVTFPIVIKTDDNDPH